MTRRNADAFLTDIRDACRRIERFAACKTLTDYESDDLLRSAIERQLMIVGEAFVQLLRLDPAFEQSFGAAHRIVDFRNILVHGYHSLRHDLVWDIVQNHLPVLRQEIAALLPRPS